VVLFWIPVGVAAVLAVLLPEVVLSAARVCVGWLACCFSAAGAVSVWVWKFTSGVPVLWLCNGASYVPLLLL
jgi:hypothetical protein